MGTTAQIIVGAVLLAAAVFLVVAVLMQEGKSYRLSGAIAGGADTIFGKTKGKKISDTLSKVTTIVSIVFVIIVVVLTIASRKNVMPVDVDDTTPSAEASASEVVSGEETPDAGEETPDNNG